MSEAIYAIPGLMPPTSPHYDTRVVLPENGKVSLCVYCGREGESVHYCLHAHGYAGGFIKDPSYVYPETKEGEALGKDKEAWPQFMRMAPELPEGIEVLKVIKDGKWAIPVTEKDPDFSDKVYWILEVPAGILPIGDTILELSVNGSVRKYTLQRPGFGAYARRDITKRYSYLKDTRD